MENLKLLSKLNMQRLKKDDIKVLKRIKYLGRSGVVTEIRGDKVQIRFEGSFFFLNCVKSFLFFFCFFKILEEKNGSLCQVWRRKVSKTIKRYFIFKIYTCFPSL